MDPIYHFAPNPFPAHLREELPYPSAPWLVSRELFKRLAAAPEIPGKYKKIELEPDDPEAMFVQRYYEQNPPHGKGIRRIYVIHSGYQTEMFEAELRKCEQEAIRFRPNWSGESEAEHRDEVYADWQRTANQFNPLEIATANRIDRIINARVLPLWHGTSQQKAESICETGFTFFGNHHLSDPNAQEGQFVITDRGFFGHGIYFTDSPSYAAKYTEENILMLAFVAMRTPFPIVSDRPHPTKCADVLRFEGNALYQTYNAHFIPVSPIAEGSKVYYPCQFEQAECNEYVIKMPSQTLARYQVEIGDGYPLFQAIITQGRNNLPLPKLRGVNEVTSEVLIEKLRAHYTAICTDLPLPMSEAMFPLKELFTQLVILESKLVEQKEKETEKQDKEKRENSSRDPSLPERDSLAEAMLYLQDTITPIAMEEFFAKKESVKKPKKVLLIGRAGIGKTTLIDRITLGWAESEMFSQFDAVFRIVLRELNDFRIQSQNLLWLAAAISHSIYKNEDRLHDVVAYIQEHESRILILLDGLDEATPELIQKLEPLLQRPDLHILITSRPGVSVAIKRFTDRQIENIGFSRTQIEDYVTKCFGRELSDAPQTAPFLEALRKDYNLLSLAHTPLQLQMLCALWERRAKDKGFGSSLTVLYTEMLEQLSLWQVNKQNPYVDTSDFSIEQKLIVGLGKVALVGLEARQLMLSVKTLKKALLGTDVTIAQLLATGLLKKSGKDYTFFHLTFQEYLIAYYISLLSSKEQWDFIRNNRYKAHYRLVMSFLAGLIYQSDCTKDKAMTKHFFQTLFSDNVDLAGYVQLELTLSCAAECPLIYDWINDTFGIEETLRKLLKDSVEGPIAIYRSEVFTKLFQLCLFRKIDTQSDWLTNDLKKMCDYQQEDLDLLMTVLLFICKLSSTIKLDEEIFNNIAEFLANSDSLMKYIGAITLGTIGANVKLDETIVSKIAELLDDSNLFVRKAAVAVLGNIGTNEKLDETIISKIAELLDDVDYDVRSKTVQVLGIIGAKGKLNETSTSKIVEILSDDYSFMRDTALKVLGEIGAYGKLNETIISKMAELLSNSELEVRSATVQALGSIGANRMLDNTIISKISELLDDRYWDVRSKTVQALGNIGTYRKLDDPIISKISELLSDRHWKVSSAAAQALGNIGANEKLDEASISKFAKLLSISNWEVRSTTVQVLGNIGTYRKLDDTIISKIAELLADNYSEVQCTAVQALENIGTYRKLDDTIISKIAELLSDSKRNVRIAAEQALGNIGANAKIDETIISKIVGFLGDSKSYVRSAAVRALGNIGANRKIDETIISKSAELLADNYSDVREDAARMLGKISANSDIDKAIISKIVELLISRTALRTAAEQALENLGTNGKLDEAIIGKIAEHADCLHHENKFMINRAIQILGKIPLSCFVKQSLTNATTLLHQAFLRQAVIYLEERNKEFYLVIREKGEETWIDLPNPDAFIEIANQSSFVGSFVSRYSKNKHLHQPTFFKEEKKKNNDCSIQ